MAKQESYTGVFGGMDFPEYEYQHYPLWMNNPKTKETRIVEDEEEEDAAKAEGFLSPKVGPPAKLTEAEHGELVATIKDREQELDKQDKKLAEQQEEIKRLQALLANGTAPKPDAAAAPAAPAKP